MSKRLQAFLVALVALSALGPALFLPRLSAHTPTISAELPSQHQAPTPLDVLRVSPLAGVTVKVKDIGTSSNKWKNRSSAASGDYTTGVQASAGEWEAKTLAAEDNYKTSVTDAAAKGRYGKGVQGKGSKYQKNATTLGPQRYQSGVANAQDSYANAMGPVLQTIASVNLPPRQPKGMNQGRSDAMATALRKMKVGS